MTSASPSSPLLSLLASLRIANLPSVISNVTLGYLLAIFVVFRFGTTSPNPRPILILLSFTACSLYFAGNLANDWFDHRWDAVHRPERALPSGHFAPLTYLITSILFATLALICAQQLSLYHLIVTLLILVGIASYTYLHKKTRWAVIPMGLCRAGLYFLGFAGVCALLFTDLRIRLELAALITTHALGLFTYIVGLSLAARYESIDHPPHGMLIISRAMLFLPLAAMGAWWMNTYPLFTCLGMIPFALWLSLCLTRFRRPTSRFVSALLAGIPLIDLITATALSGAFMEAGHSQLSLVALIVPAAAFSLGIILQNLSPAT